MNPQAVELNTLLQNTHPVILDLLSRKGKEIFFPKKGILSQAADAKGKDINATIGIAVENDGSPMRLKTIADKIDLDPKDIFPYAPSYGKPELRTKWQEMIVKKNPALKGKEISLPVATHALTHGLTMAAYLFCDPGSKIIIPDFYWGNYNLLFKNGFDIEFDTFTLFKDNAFNVEGLKERLLAGSPEKKVLLMNFPNNPTGYTPTQDEMKEIVAAIKASAEKGHKLVILIDDAYYGLFYEDSTEKQSIFAYLADLHENVLAVKLDGATKEYYVWGLRVGFMTFGIKNGTKEIYNALEAKVAGAIRGNISNVSHLSQSIVLEAFSAPHYLEEKKAKYEILEARYHKVKEVLENHPEYSEFISPYPFNSGYFMCLALIDKLSGDEVRKQLLENYSTGIIAFGNTLRIAFSSVAVEKIPTLFDNIYRACKDLS